MSKTYDKQGYKKFVVIMKIFKRKIRLAKKRAFICSALGLVILLAVFFVADIDMASAEWREPLFEPIIEELYPPLTTGPENQAKRGYLDLKPEYDPSPQSSLSFDPERPLHVHGAGALFSTDYLYNDVLTVDTDTLYVTAIHDWVGIGTTDFFVSYQGTDAWANEDFQFRKKMNFSNQKLLELSESVYGIPIIVKADDSDDFADFWSGVADTTAGNDIIFATSDGTILKHHFEKFNYPRREMVAWVRVPRLQRSIYDYIYVYFGNGSAADIRDEVGTYDGYFQGVWHLNQVPSVPILDSTSNNIDGTAIGGMADTDLVGANIGLGLDMDGSDDYIDLPDINFSTNSVSFEGWVKLNEFGDNDVAFSSGHQGDDDMVAIWFDDNNSGFISSIEGDTSDQVDGVDGGDISSSIDTWTHFTVVFNRTTNKMIRYVNGEQHGTVTDISSIPVTDVINADGWTSIGAFDTVLAGEFVNGIIDEFRVSNVARSADWIKAIYLSESDTLISWGSRENYMADIGPDISRVKLIVNGGTMQVGTESSPISGTAVAAYSSDGVGVYGDVGTSGEAGVYALRSSATKPALKGESLNDVGMRGESIAGYGIYASTYSDNMAAVYGSNTSTGLAGYFDGRLNIAADLVAKQFLPSGMYKALIPFVSGVRVGYHNVSNDSVSSMISGMAFDGSNLWISNKYGDPDGNIFKVRAADGLVLDAFNYPVSSDYYIQDITFDGQYLWLDNANTDTDEYTVIKVDPSDGSEIVSCPTSSGNYGHNPLDVITSTIDGQVFIWTVNETGADLTKVSSDCSQTDVYPIGSTGSGDDLNRLNDAGWRLKPKDIIFADDHIWTLTPNLCAAVAGSPDTDGPCLVNADCGSNNCIDNSDNLIKVETDGQVDDRYATGLATPGKMIFDGMYIWAISSAQLDGGVANPEQKISKVRASDGQIVDGYPKDLGILPLGLAFDGTYIWVSGAGEDVLEGGLKRISVYNGEIRDYPGILSTNDWLGELLFDGNYLWSLSACDGDDQAGSCSGGADKPLKLTKVYTGTSMGQMDMNTVINLRQRVSHCSDTVAQECVLDIHCPTDETCDNGFGSQTGSMNVSGEAVITNSHCYDTATSEHRYSASCSVDADCAALGGTWVCRGGDIYVGQDVSVPSNQWEGTDQTVSVSSNEAECPAGYFIKGVTLDANGVISDIICRGL